MKKYYRCVLFGEVLVVFDNYSTFTEKNCALENRAAAVQSHPGLHNTAL